MLSKKEFRSLTKSFKSLLSFLFYGYSLRVTEEKRKERLAICGREQKHLFSVSKQRELASCPFQQNGICNLCGCFVSIKVRLASEQCPAGYWKKETPLNQTS
jgi:hypothetical protein